MARPLRVTCHPVIEHLSFQLVIGSAVYAFEEVCPERVDLIHKHYRKLCQLLVDVDEWGQVIIINMLTRYARSQFTDPNEGVKLLLFSLVELVTVLFLQDEAQAKEEKFYSSSEHSDDDEAEEEEKKESVNTKPYVMDPDLRMLLKNTKSLLQSRNTAVSGTFDIAKTHPPRIFPYRWSWPYPNCITIWRRRTKSESSPKR